MVTTLQPALHVRIMCCLFVFRVSQLTQRLSSTLSDLSEERQLGKALRTNQAQWQTRVTSLEQRLDAKTQQSDQEIKDLKEQLRDLMFYLEAQNMIAKSDHREEIATGSITVGPANEEKKKKKKK